MTDNNAKSSSVVFVHHVLASGALNPAWPAPGVDLARGIDVFQHLPTLISDGSAGAIVVWRQGANGNDLNMNIVAHRVLANGTMDPAWPMAGAVLSNLPQQQVQINLGPRLVGDGAGGAIVVWQDYRDGTVTGGNLYAQHVFANGDLDPAWPTNGTPVCTAPGHQTSPKLISDGSGGAIFTWDDRRSSTNGVYVQRIRSDGAKDPNWPLDGLKLTTENFDQSTPTIAPDGIGGAFITWVADNGGLGIVAQHVQPDAEIDQMLWPTILAARLRSMKPGPCSRHSR